jgi:multicomponent Na+:H+ antiporter subunit G
LSSFITAPITAQVIARAAYLVGAELWRGTVIDELRGRREEGPEARPEEPAA